ncbi:MAG: hypothetical protein IJ461_02885, partial [Clostridia bacterium]|nr:hypothetical protein [Clostridia bacterium]
AAMNLKKLARWLGRFRLPFSLLSLFCFFLYEKPSSRFRENWVFLQAEKKLELIKLLLFITSSQLYFILKLLACFLFSKGV